MRKLISLAVLGLALGVSPAFAASHAGAPKADEKKKEMTPQQMRMAECNKDAEGKKGDERKKFMSSCLKDKQAAQQAKMKTCNAEAKDKKGDERKKFMSECLKKG